MMQFPYALRESQEDLLRIMRESVHRGHLVVEAGTGIGKTVCALHAAGSEALEHDKKVLYLVRTNSQQRQVMIEAHKLGLPTAALQGRHNLCIHLRNDEEFGRASAEDLSRACQDRKARTRRGEEGCPYYQKLVSNDQTVLGRWAATEMPTAEETAARCSSVGVCPYEFVKSILPDMRAVTAPYVYFIHPMLRSALLRWMNTSIEDVILVIDEAHNLPECARELGSARLTISSLHQAKSEIEQFGDPEVLSGVSATDVCDIIRKAALELARDYVLDEDGLLPPSAFEEYLMSRLTTTTTRLKHMAMNLSVQGEIVREQKRLQGKIPKSHLSALGSFLLFWLNEEGWEYVRLALGGANPGLECWCLDPSEVTRVVNDCWSSIHMSGTLTPLEEYRDSIGLPPETKLARYPSPFPPENRRIFIDESLTTKYDVLSASPDAVRELKERLLEILLAVERNTAVFFPSHELLRRFLDLRSHLLRPLYVEEQGMGQADFMEVVSRFRADNAVLFAVSGGRVSEGMDFPARDLELAVIVGIPYPKPTARLNAMITFYDAKFQRGWDYAVDAPARRRLRQAIGRLIRSETDRGIAIILDGRAKRFRGVLTDMEPREDYLEETIRFFSKNAEQPTESEPQEARPSLASAGHRQP